MLNRFLHSRRQAARWWRQSDSNRRHSACKADALPTELCPPLGRGRRRPTASSVCAEIRVHFFGRRGKQARRAMCRRVRPFGEEGASPSSLFDELTIGIPVARVRLLRKEVIQPQVPLRLPCYDFIPITTHTLGDSLPCGLGRRLRVQTAFMM